MGSRILSKTRIGGTLPVALIALTLLAPPAYGQGCAVSEERGRETITGHFAIGPTGLRITIPHKLYAVDPLTTFLEVSNAAEASGLFVDAGGEKTPLRNGARLLVFPEYRRRLIFSVTRADGTRLCDWPATVGIFTGSPPHIAEGIDFVRLWRFDHAHSGFRNTGDPILLRVGGKLAREGTEFKIDGSSMPILAKTSWQVILRDPNPQSGFRTITSQGYSAEFPFISLQLSLQATSSPRRGTLEIKVSGRKDVNLPALPEHRLWLYNYSPEKLTVQCGKEFRPDDQERVDIRFLNLARNTAGDFVASCKVQIRQPGAISLNGDYQELELRTLLRGLLPSLTPEVPNRR